MPEQCRSNGFRYKNPDLLKGTEFVALIFRFEFNIKLIEIFLVGIYLKLYFNFLRACLHMNACACVYLRQCMYVYLRAGDNTFLPIVILRENMKN